MNSEQKRPKIDYPCEWNYRVIGTDPELMRLAIASVIPEMTCNIDPSNASRTGKYVSLNVQLIVFSEEERDRLYQSLAGHEHIKMVM